jgi:hypothetical protein
MVRPLKARVLTLILPLAILLTFGTDHLSAIDQTGEGDGFLRMTPETRSGFLLGYTIGLSRGFAQGCLAYRSIAEFKTHDVHNDPFGRCVNRGPGFSRSVDYYVKQVTDFYESFPADRNVPFEEVLKKLSDSENMTPSQMHAWFEKHRHRK